MQIKVDTYFLLKAIMVLVLQLVIGKCVHQAVAQVALANMKLLNTKTELLRPHHLSCLRILMTTMVNQNSGMAIWSAEFGAKSKCT